MGEVFAKNTSLETKFSSLDRYFSQMPLPNMIYLFKILQVYRFRDRREKQ